MKVLYLHVPKTGGTSVTKVLAEHNENVVTERHPIYRDSPKYHQTFDYVINFKLSRAQHFKYVIGDLYEKLWTVAIVRNPWDRYVSNWKWLTRKESLYPRKGWKARGWFGEDGQVSFDSFVKQMSWCYKNQSALHGYQHDKWHIRNQIEHLTDERGNVIIDHIGKFETLQQEFDLICKKSELSLRLPHLNRVGHYSGEKEEHKPIKIHYSTYYTQELIDIVAARCMADIEAFKYDFEEERK